MAPHKFWLKRQLDIPGLPNLPGLGDEDEDETTTILSSSSTPAATSSTLNPVPRPSSISSILSSIITTPTPSTVPSSPASDEDEVEETPAASSPTATPVSSDPAESLPLLPSSTPITSAPLTSTVVQSETVLLDAPAETGAGNVGASKNAFLENKVLSGIVFGACGLVGLILLIVIILFATRKARRNRRLEKEIISWDPNHVQSLGKKDEFDTGSVQDLEEKGRLSRSNSSSQQGHYTYTLPSKALPGNNSNPATNAPYSDYGQQPVPIHVALPTTGGGNQQAAYRW